MKNPVCPQCGFPLGRRNGKLVCCNCGKLLVEILAKLQELDEFLLEHFKKDTPLQKIVDSLD